MKIQVPTGDATAIELDVESGQTLFVLGANGAGKSALVQRLFVQGGATTFRIAAHRTNYFQAESPGLSPQERQSNESNARNADTLPDARWKDDYGNVRHYVSLFDLVDSVNRRARGIAAAVDANDFAKAEQLRSKESSLTILNRLLRLSNVGIEISVDEGSRVVANRPGGGAERYSVSRLSDGERNALLLACDVLNAKSGSLLIIDEPERHLHPSIISPLLTMLLRERADVAFIVATHDVSLPLEKPDARTLLLRSCKFVSNQASSWDCDLISGAIPEDIKADVLGARRAIVFVEGTDSSLDKPLYATVFPNVSVIAKDSCADVEHCVKGARGTKEMNWLKAWGIVDGDFSDPGAKDRLEKHGIYALPFHSVESIYYHPVMQERVTARRTTEAAKQQHALQDAANATLKCFDRHVQRMASRSIERKIREEIKLLIPGQTAIASMTPVNISIDVRARVEAEAARLEGLIKAADVSELITKFPVRETGALLEIARALGFRDREDYERSLLTALLDDADVLECLRGLLGAAGVGIAT